MQKSPYFLKHKYALAVGLTTLLAAPVQAANRYVTNANDSGSGSLRAVVAAAANDDTVIINANVGQITLTSGQIDILKNLTIKGGGSSRAVISGNNLSRIFASKITNRTLTLENLHLKNGQTTAPINTTEDCFTTDGRGGAVCANSKLVIKNSQFSHNKTTGDKAHGGAVYAAQTLTVIDSLFESNKTEGFSATSGAVLASEPSIKNIITNTVFNKNTANYNMGAVGVKHNVKIENSRFLLNNASNAVGALYVGGELTLTSSQFKENTASDGVGGALYIGGKSVITSSEFQKNKSTDDGGAIFVYTSENYLNLTMSNSDFKENEAYSGGAIYIKETGTSMITGGMFTNNKATGGSNRGNGGAINNGASLKLTVSGVAFNTNQSTGDGGALYSTGNNTIITNVSAIANISGGKGGAITISGIINNSYFERNKSQKSGGAVYGDDRFTKIDSSFFKSNTAQETGGAIAKVPWLSNSVVRGNNTVNDSGNGGGIYDVYKVTNSIIDRNYTLGASSHGGGIAGIDKLIDSTVSNNYTSGSASYGGGVGSDSEYFEITNSTVANNKTLGPSSLAGGIYNTGGKINNSTVTNNSTVYAPSGGIYVAGNTLTLVSSTINGNNQSGVINNCELGGSASIVSTYSLISNSGQYACGITASSSNHNIVGSNAQLGALADNGCAVKAGNDGNKECVKTMKLLASSPAINAGTADSNLVTDQRGAGYARVSDGQADIGAFETQVQTFTVGGSVSGLSGTLKISNGTETKTLTSNTTFSFSGYTAGENYTISVSSKPSVQNCRVDNGSGTVSGNVTNVKIVCFTPQFQVKGSVSGLSGTLKLSNGKETKTVTKNTSFAFNGYKRGDKYHITVVSQPSNQTCTLSKGSGTISGNVTNVTISCADNQKYSVGGHIAMEKGDTITISNGKETKFFDKTECFFCGLPFLFTFGDYKSGESYEIKISQYPENQTCTLSHAKGRVTKDIDNVVITCAKKGIIFNDGFE